MRDQIAQRLNELQSEFAVGQKTLDDLEAKQVNLRQTLLRISGAIQVLEELLHTEAQPATEPAAPQVHTVPPADGLDAHA